MKFLQAKFSLLRGVCQTPAYVAYEKGFFREEGVDASVEIVATAWLIPEQLEAGATQFAVLPWTRVASSALTPHRLVAVCGSGIEEAAIVVRAGLELSQIRRIAVPREGGIKDLTAMALFECIGCDGVEIVRTPSGDGAIISLFAQGADAAAMVEPYASAMEALGVGRVRKRTGELWPGAPGCSLATSVALRDARPDLVARVVRAYVRAAAYVAANPKDTARLAQKYIGISDRFIECALQTNRPNVDALRNQDAMDAILDLMIRRGYIQGRPTGYCDLSFLECSQAQLKPTLEPHGQFSI